MKKIILKFQDWLINQQHREDVIGDLARMPDMQNMTPKVSRRKADEHRNWVEVVIRLSEPEYIAVFNEAWQEFLLAKLAAADPGD